MFTQWQDNHLSQMQTETQNNPLHKKEKKMTHSYSLYWLKFSEHNMHGFGQSALYIVYFLTFLNYSHSLQSHVGPTQLLKTTPPYKLITKH